MKEFYNQGILYSNGRLLYGMGILYGERYINMCSGWREFKVRRGLWR